MYLRHSFRRNQFVGVAARSGPDEEVGLLRAFLGRLNEDLVPAPLDEKRALVSNGHHRHWLAEFNDGQVIPRRLDPGNCLVILFVRFQFLAMERRGADQPGRED